MNVPLRLTWRFALAAGLAISLMQGSSATASDPTPIDRPPRLDPDYTDVVIPPNLAPPNFVIAETGVVRHSARFVPTQGAPIQVSGKSDVVTIPPHAWQELAKANVGQQVRFEISVEQQDGTWSAFQPITNAISADPIDGYLVYRLLRPVYNFYGPIGIYQRDLATYTEKPILENRAIEDGCLNCHTFLNQHPAPMALHIRHKGAGNPMLLVTSNGLARVDKTSGYLAWHPSGRLLTFSINQFALLFHTAGETRDLYDGDSDLGIYRVDSNVVVSPPAISIRDRLETWPTWSPDGRFLYFCSAPKLKIERLKQIRYDLMRVSYDLSLDRWGEPETVVAARETALSAAQPRISPDGQWLLFCLSPYGNFPAYSPGSDLYLLNLATNSNTPRRLEINSGQADSWHCWSSNGRWVVFSSKRRDGLFTRPYLAHMDSTGNFSKPFLLPQKDPTFYDAFTRTYNLPELIQEPVTVSPADLARAALKPKVTLKPQPVPSGPNAELPPVHEPNEGRSTVGDGSQQRTP
jgi:hypothetical protein